MAKYLPSRALVKREDAGPLIDIDEILAAERRASAGRRYGAAVPSSGRTTAAGGRVAKGLPTGKATEAAEEMLPAVLKKAGKFGKLLKFIPWLAVALSAYDVGSGVMDEVVGKPRRKKAEGAAEGLDLIDTLGRESAMQAGEADLRDTEAAAFAATQAATGRDIGALMREQELAQIIAGNEDVVRAAQPVNTPSMAEIMARLGGL